MPDSPRRPLVLGLSPRSLAALDLATAAAYGVLACASLADQESSLPPLLGAALVAGPIAAQRRAPRSAYAVLLLAMALAPASAALGFLALPPLALVLGRLAARRSALCAVPLLLLGLAATSLPDAGHNGAAVPFGLVLVAAWAVGLALGQQQRYARDLLTHREALALEQAREAAAAERLRLARELHDVVAHSLSAVTVQAAYGNVVFAERPDDARAALGAVETTGRQALAQMRDLLGVLREPGMDRAALAPAPTLHDLDQLIADTARAGVRVDLTVTGLAEPLPSGVDRSAFRIVQEALTNVVRHANTASAVVSLSYTSSELVIGVTDDGCGPAAGLVVGHGLVGIRERVALHGGRVAFGPGTDGGFQVHARLPLPGLGA